MTHASVFSGIGGPEVAASMLGWENLFHCEINPFGRAVLDYWYPEAESYEDITKTDFTKWQGRVSVLTGGFPCQPFSVAGQRRGAEDDRYLWPHMHRCICEVRPDWVVCENVGGILSMVEQGSVLEVASEAALFGAEDTIHRYEYRGTFTLERISRDLEADGYTVQSVLIPACAVGAPHRRDRVFIVGHRNESAEDTMCLRRGKRKDEEQGSERLVGNAGTGNTQRVCRETRTAADTDSLRQSGRRSEDSRQRTDNETQQRREFQRKSERPSSRWPIADTDSDRGCEVDEHVEPQLTDGAEPERNGGERDATDTSHAGLQETRSEQQATGYWRPDIRIGEWGKGLSDIEVTRDNRWRDFPSVSPVYRGNDGLPFPVDDLTIPFLHWRNESLKAYGNAIVPQVMYEIFRAIEQVENNLSL